MQRPTEEQLEGVRERWGLRGEVKFLRRVENFVYQATLEDRTVFLRLTEPHHRSAQEIQGELDWMDYLAGQGMRIAAPIHSRDDALVETIEGDEVYHAALFEQAHGAPLKDKEDFTPEVLRAWGAYVGKMHRLTKGYQPGPQVQPRAQWNEDNGFKVTLKGVDKADPIAYERFHQCMEWLSGLEKDDECFGLVHADLHHGNFFVERGRITAFDFDDCAYHWFVYDLVTPFFNLLKMSDAGFFDRPFEETKALYLEGYSQENTLAPKWLARVDAFLLFRISTVYHWVKASHGAGVLSGSTLEWVKEVLPWCRRRLTPKMDFV